MRSRTWGRILMAALAALCAIAAGGAARVVQDTCGPFTDVSALFCPYVLEVYYTGISAGTSPTTFSPDAPTTRGQAAVFAAKGLNQALARGSRRAALGQWWTTTPHYEMGLGVTTVDSNPAFIACDGADVWTANLGAGSVSRVRASDGRVLETWTGASAAFTVVAAMGRVFVAARSGSEANGRGGRLYAIDPTQPAGDVAVVTDSLWSEPQGIAFDGANLWVASAGGPGTDGGALSIVHPGPTYPWSYTEIKNNVQIPSGGILFDGQSIWFCDTSNLKKMDSAGNLLQTVPLGHAGESPVFDGANIWVPSQDGHVTVVAAATGAVIADLSGNGLATPFAAAFDGERVLVTNYYGPSVSLWRAADLSPLGSVPVTGAGNRPLGACSDGINFWVSLQNSPGQLGRF